MGRVYEARGDFEGAFELFTAAARGAPPPREASGPQVDSVFALSDAGLAAAAADAAAVSGGGGATPQPACAHGAAAYRAGVLVYRGAGALASMTAAAAWFRAAGACVSGAAAARGGGGVPRAASAAGAGSADGANALGILLEDGVGVARDTGACARARPFSIATPRASALFRGERGASRNAGAAASSYEQATALGHAAAPCVAARARVVRMVSAVIDGPRARGSYNLARLLRSLGGDRSVWATHVLLVCARACASGCGRSIVCPT